MMKDTIRHLLSQALDACSMPSENIVINTPNNPDHGDYTSPVAMSLAKSLKKAPFEVAGEIVKAFQQDPRIDSVTVVRPGFINISLASSFLLEELLKIQNDTDFGKSDLHKDKRSIVEFSSPNIAKPFTIGHLRSTIIGAAVANLLEATGYEVFRDNHVGDWGTQFGKQIYAIKELEPDAERTIAQSDRPVKELVRLYVKFHELAESDSTLEERGREWFKKLEDGDEEARRLWKLCIDWSWKEFNAIYTKLNISLTENDGRGYGESYFEDKMKPIIDELEETLGPKGMYKESKGAKLVFFQDEKYPPLMITKQDGATLYATRDLATDKFRLTNPRYGVSPLIINEVGAEQSLYFNQLYETEKMLGWVKEAQRVHVKHGMYRFKKGKMSTRKGNVIWLEDVLEEAVQRAQNLVKNTDGTIQTDPVAIGALKWNDLKRSSHLDIVFDWDEILSMDGNSGPYMQYTYVRCMSVLEKAPKEQPLSQFPETCSGDDLNLIRELIKFPEVIVAAAESYAPNILCTYLFELAQNYNMFYQKNPILKADTPELIFLRLSLTRATSRVIHNGLSILGIETVLKM